MSQLAPDGCLRRLYNCDRFRLYIVFVPIGEYYEMLLSVHQSVCLFRSGACVQKRSY